MLALTFCQTQALLPALPAISRVEGGACQVCKGTRILGSTTCSVSARKRLTNHPNILPQKNLSKEQKVYIVPLPVPGGEQMASASDNVTV
jgi:hypothetical protein